MLTCGPDWKRGKPVFDLQSDHAVYEFVPDHGA